MTRNFGCCLSASPDWMALAQGYTLPCRNISFPIYNLAACTSALRLVKSMVLTLCDCDENPFIDVYCFVSDKINGTAFSKDEH